jgi:two-component system nitrogen regulation sensor histidine kinase NtrY
LRTIESHMNALGLGRFVEAFTKFARLPEPRKALLEVGDLVASVMTLHSAMPVTLTLGPNCRISGDRDQLEQLLKNASEAVEHVTSPLITVTWRSERSTIVIVVGDNGTGIANTSNLFVPFFTTKKGGSGIGLALSRQIAESHGGTLNLENRPEGGCVALLGISFVNG